MLRLDVAAVDVAQLCKAFEQRFEIWVFLFRASCMPEIADVGNLSAGLRPRDARYLNQGAADDREDITPSNVEHGFSSPLRVGST